MVNRNYVKGRAFEYAVRKHYESKGYTVIRSAGSKGKIDLLAWKCACKAQEHFSFDESSKTACVLVDRIKAIQCKVYDSKATKPLRTDVELLRAVQVPAGWDRVLAWRVHGESEFKEEVV